MNPPVSIEFEDIHISEIVDFIADSWDVNIVIDNRAVMPPPTAQPAQTTTQQMGPRWSWSISAQHGRRSSRNAGQLWRCPPVVCPVVVPDFRIREERRDNRDNRE